MFAQMSKLGLKGPRKSSRALFDTSKMSCTMTSENYISLVVRTEAAGNAFSSVTRLDDFLKNLDENFSYKNRPNIC